MRLTRIQIKAIWEVFALHFMKEDSIWLFGSRADDNKKGGDIDLYIETNYTDLFLVASREISFLTDLTKVIGDQKIDVIINVLCKNKDLPIYKQAKNTGVLISMNSRSFLTDYTKIADIHAISLREALGEVNKLTPITVSVLESLSRQQVAFLDMMTTRFGKLQDILGSKILPLILEVLEEEAESFVDKLNKLEKLGYIEDANWWGTLRIIRNQIAHDYTDYYGVICEHLSIFLSKATELLEFWNRLKIKIVKL
jgi:hypothetical protein